MPFEVFLSIGLEEIIWVTDQSGVFESCDHHNAKWTFNNQDHQPTKIYPILQARFLYSVNIYKI